MFFSVNSFVELVEYLFTVPGVKVFLSSKVNQDGLEKYFSMVRQNRGSNENPTVHADTTSCKFSM